MAAHAVSGSGIEAIVAEKSLGNIRGEDLSIKEHRYHIRIFGAELHIVGDH